MKILFISHRGEKLNRFELIISKLCNGKRVMAHTEIGSVLLIGQYDSVGAFSCWQSPSWSWGGPVWTEYIDYFGQFGCASKKIYIFI